MLGPSDNVQRSKFSKLYLLWFSRYTLLLKNGRGPATPLMTPTDHRPYICELSLCISTYCKNNFEKISIRFKVTNN